MKKTTWLLGAFFLGGTLLTTTLATPVVSATTAGPGTATANLSDNTKVSAGQPVSTASATQNASAKSTAQFTVEAGQLALVAVPDLNFGAANPATIVNGGSQKLVNNTLGQSAVDDNNAGELIVSDMRGTGNGWSLSASMDPVFASGDSKLNGLSMTLKATGNNSFFDPKNQHLNLKGTTISDTSTSVVSTNADNNGVGDTTFNLNADDSAILNFPPAKNSIFTAKAAYQSDVTWTLGATPTP